MARDTHPGYETDSAALERLCGDELAHALCHAWDELAPLAPFTDVCEPCREVPHLVHRSYSWAGTEGGDIVCRVSVYERPDGTGHVVSRDCVIRPG
jgi:hypothetical protein